MTSLDSFRCCKTLEVGSKTYAYFSLPTAERNGLKGISRLPFSMKVLLENLLRNEDGRTVTKDDIKAFAEWLKTKTSNHEFAFRPARVLMQDFTGVPAVVDLAAMRDAMKALGGDPKKINPQVPVDLVIDHSVAVTFFGNNQAFKKNVEEEYRQNQERYKFLKWAQRSFDNFSVVPPGTGICHQVNLEYLSRVVWSKKDKVKVDGKPATMDVAYPDTLVGTDSHTTMVNGLSVLGWGVGGIEAEAAMLGQPLSMTLPEVIGFKLSGKLKEGVTATDLVLTVTQMLRERGVVGKFVEFFGPGLTHLTIADRATLGNMSPEYGATCGFSPIDDDTIRYLKDTGRPADVIALVRPMPRRRACSASRPRPIRCSPTSSSSISLRSSPRSPVPKRPQDRVALKEVKAGFASSMDKEFNKSAEIQEARAGRRRKNYDIGHGDVVIAAITSCTNTSNPNVMIGAGLLARKAAAKGLTAKPWVKTSLAPGSQVVAEYLEKSGLQKDLDKLGFNLVGFGCTTCIGNSGPLPPENSKAINDGDLVAAAVLSGNRNFEGRVNADVRANYLASPPLVVAYAIAGSMNVDLVKEPIGADQKGKKVFLKDIWPSNKEIGEFVAKNITRQIFAKKYADVFKGDANWRKIARQGRPDLRVGRPLDLRAESALLRRHGEAPQPIEDIVDARVLGAVPQLDHHRSHLAGGLDQGSEPGRRISARPPGPPEGLQPIRHAPRQSSGDDARHLRQYPHQEPDGAGRRRRRHHSLSVEAAHDDLRRGHEVQGRQRSAGDLRRQGIRHRLVARLGGQGHGAARRPRGRHPVVRAHPPLQPDRHGRDAAGIRGRHVLAVVGHEGRRAGHHSRPAWRAQAAPAADRRDRRRQWHAQARAADLPHRYARMSSITSRTAAFCSTCCAIWPA